MDSLFIYLSLNKRLCLCILREQQGMRRSQPFSSWLIWKEGVRSFLLFLLQKFAGRGEALKKVQAGPKSHLS